MPIKYSNNKRVHERGIALVLSVLILANIFMITLVVSDVILRISRTGRDIRDSEIAYMAAESSIEKAIYSIEKSHDAAGLGVPATPTGGALTEVNGTWSRYVEPVTTLTLVCLDPLGHQSFYTATTLTTLITALGGNYGTVSCVYAANFSSSSNLTKSNPLKIFLAPGMSFELKFDVTAPSAISFYPNKLDFSWAAYPGGSTTPAGQLVILNSAGQTVADTALSTSLTLPMSGSFSNPPNYRVRIVNKESTSYVVYTIGPNNSSDNLPIGIRVTATGFYGTSAKERIIVVERRNWEIY